MKILVDGYALAIRQGTGLTRHAIETLGALDALGCSRDLLLGTPVPRVSDKILPSAVLQGMLAGAQSGLRQTPFKSWPSIAINTGRHALDLGARASTLRRLHYDDEKVYVDASINFQNFNAVFNSNDLFRCAFAWAAFTGHNISVSFPVSEAKPDLFHCTSPVPVKVRGVPRVTTLHDLIPLTFPQSTQVPLRSYYQVVRAALRDCAMVCCVSEHSAREAAAFFDLPEDRLAVTYQAVDLGPYREQLDDHFVQSVLREYHLEPGRYLLFNGAVEPKKNLDRLLSAYVQSGVGLPLVVLGPSGWLHEATEARMQDLKNGKLQRIVRIKYLDRLSQLAILRGARCLCFPSLSEGFGLPVLEAMSLGVPVITSQHPALLEVAGEAALAVDPKSIGALVSAMRHLARDDLACKELAARGQVQASKFTRQRYAERLRAAYARALQGT